MTPDSEFEIEFSGSLHRAGQCKSICGYLGNSPLAPATQKRAPKGYYVPGIRSQRISEAEAQRRAAATQRRYKQRQAQARREAETPSAWAVKQRLQSGFSIRDAAGHFGISTSAVRRLGGCA